MYISDIAAEASLGDPLANFLICEETINRRSTTALYDTGRNLLANMSPILNYF